MKPLLVHVHIYYINLWEELKSCLKNIEPFPYDLYVTMVENHIDLQKDILDFNPKAKIEVVENRGFDIAPFVEVINKVNLDDYSYIIKLHTKRDVENECNLNGFNLSYNKWRESLLSFISTKKNFNKTLQLLNQEKIAMIGSYKLLTKEDSHILSSFLEKHNFPKLDYCFIGGTMFMAKPNIFKPLQGLLSLKDFKIELPHKTGFAHVIERFFGYLVFYNKQKIYLNLIQKSGLFLARINQFLYQNKITKSGKQIIKICKIPVCCRRLKNDKF